jgi:hypothetical protein
VQNPIIALTSSLKTQALVHEERTVWVEERVKEFEKEGQGMITLFAVEGYLFDAIRDQIIHRVLSTQP